MNLALPIFALVVAGLGLLWFFVPILSGIPWVPTGDKRILKALELARLQPDEKFYDLGCGDGRVLIAAARHFGARAVGIEISPLHCLVARVRVRASGLGKFVSVHWGNFYKASLEDADVVYQFGHSRHARKLKGRLEGHLRDGTRFVSVMVDIPGWQPEAVDKDELIFLYRMPPPPGDVTDFLMKGAV